MTAYAARKDVYKYGLPRGTLGMPARLVATCLAATDTVELDGHGFETDDQILFRAAQGGTLSAPLVAGTTYYAIRVNDSMFQVASVPAGSAINLTTDGVSMLVASPLPFDDVLEFYSRWADGFLPAHIVPLVSPIPIVVSGVVAELASKKLQQLAGHTSVSVGDFYDEAQKLLERWAKGIPLRDPGGEAAANKAVESSVVLVGVDPRGWGSSSLP